MIKGLINLVDKAVEDSLQQLVRQLGHAASREINRFQGAQGDRALSRSLTP